MISWSIEKLTNLSMMFTHQRMDPRGFDFMEEMWERAAYIHCKLLYHVNCCWGKFIRIGSAWSHCIHLLRYSIKYVPVLIVFANIDNMQLFFTGKSLLLVYMIDVTFHSFISIHVCRVLSYQFFRVYLF